MRATERPSAVRKYRSPRLSSCRHPSSPNSAAATRSPARSSISAESCPVKIASSSPPHGQPPQLASRAIIARASSTRPSAASARARARVEPAILHVAPLRLVEPRQQFGDGRGAFQSDAAAPHQEIAGGRLGQIVDGALDRFQRLILSPAKLLDPCQCEVREVQGDVIVRSRENRQRLVNELLEVARDTLGRDVQPNPVRLDASAQLKNVGPGLAPSQDERLGALQRPVGVPDPKQHFGEGRLDHEINVTRR